MAAGFDIMEGFAHQATPTPDSRLRSLERRVVNGDVTAAPALHREQERAGQPLYIGIDPGRGGYIVAISGSGHQIIWAEPMPVVGDGKKWSYDLQAIWRIVQRIPSGAFVTLERQQAYPEQGVSSSFKTGYGFGLLEMALTAARVTFETVHPRTWKGKMGIVAQMPGAKAHQRKKAAKERAIAAALRLFPDTDFLPVDKPKARKPSGDYAEGALLALYGRRHLSG